MKYYFDYGFAKDGKWLDGQHKLESYDNDKQAFARYIEIQMKGRKAEMDLKAKNMLPEGNTFQCTIDVFHDGEYNLGASLAFFEAAFNVLKDKQSSTEPQ